MIQIVIDKLLWNKQEAREWRRKKRQVPGGTEWAREGGLKGWGSSHFG